tara:strand:+ start:1434 stop:1754 length:321 start_codon:yes stop_codon:yes gene_type:complete
MVSTIDAVRPTTETELTGLARDVQTVKRAAWHIADACRAGLRTIKAKAEVHGLSTLKAEMSAAEVQAVTQAVQAARQVLAALGPDYDPGDIPNDPLPPPPEIEEPE